MTPAHAGRPPTPPRPFVLVVAGPITGASVAEMCERLVRAVESGDADLVVCDVSAVSEPDVTAVGALARIALTARRLGRPVRLRNAPYRLRELLALSGLSEVVQTGRDLPLEPRRQAEEREQPRGVEERVEPDDPIC